MQGRTILITGASRGLGRALFRQLSEKGARVVGVAREAGPLLEVVQEIRAAGGLAWGIPADVGDPEAVARLLGEATALIGPIEILINNASTLGPVPLLPSVDQRWEEQARVLAVNLLGPLALIRGVAGAMELGGGGLILNLSSDAAVSPYPMWGAYGASKAALDHWSRILAEEHPKLIFLSVDPGEMDTRMHAEAMPEADPSTLARPEKVANTIIGFLQSPPPSGSRLTVGGAS